MTTPERTWADLAGVLPPAALLAVTDQLLDVLCSRSGLAAALAARASTRGVRRAREVLAVADPRAGSPMESVLRWLLHEAGLPAPVLQHPVRDARGTAWADLAWPDRKVIVEFDGEVHRSSATRRE